MHQVSPTGSVDAQVTLTQDSFTTFSLACDRTNNGWAAASFSDIVSGVTSAVVALRVDNTTTIEIASNTDVNLLILDHVSVVDGVVAYSVGNTSNYALQFYALEPKGTSSPSSVPVENAPGSATPTDSPQGAPLKAPSKVSFASATVASVICLMAWFFTVFM
ncbi:hypothetical protein HW132_35070 [Brasilonema sp. CT11]|nr:hypothetical protein [Brasilonema sp. CT11]